MHKHIIALRVIFCEKSKTRLPDSTSVPPSREEKASTAKSLFASIAERQCFAQGAHECGPSGRLKPLRFCITFHLEAARQHYPALQTIQENPSARMLLKISLEHAEASSSVFRQLRIVASFRGIAWSMGA